MFSRKFFGAFNRSIFFLSLVFIPFIYAQEQKTENSDIEVIINKIEGIMADYSRGPVKKDAILLNMRTVFNVQIDSAKRLALDLESINIQQAYLQKIEALLFKATFISQISTEGWRNDTFPLFTEEEFELYLVSTYGILGHPQLGLAIIDAIQFVKNLDLEIKKQGVTSYTLTRTRYCKEELEVLKEKHPALFEEIKIKFNEMMNAAGPKFSEFILE